LSFGLIPLLKKWAEFFLESRHDLRFLIFTVSILSQLVFLIIGSETQLSSQRIEQIIESLPSELVWHDVLVHNAFVSVFNFIPAYGYVWNCLVSFNTGIAVKAVALNSGYPSSFEIMFLSILPHYWFEDLAYAMATTAGVMLFLSILTFKTSIILYELKGVAQSFLLWIALLFFASFLETVNPLEACLVWIVIIPLGILLFSKDLKRFGVSERLILLIIASSLAFVMFSIFLFPFILFSFILYGFVLFLLLGYAYQIINQIITKTKNIKENLYNI